MSLACQYIGDDGGDDGGDVTSVVVFKYKNGKLKVGKKYKYLRAIFPTQVNYLPMNRIPDSLVASKVRSSLFSSEPSGTTCEYIKWKQVSPEDRAAYGLSWVVATGQSIDPREVIQLLTSQLEYTVSWKARLIDPSKPGGKITLVLPEETVGYEPWDINGDKIVITTPRGEETTKG
jgi:hypothetical protein